MSLIMTYCRADGPGAAVDSGGGAPVRPGAANLPPTGNHYRPAPGTALSPGYPNLTGQLRVIIGDVTRVVHVPYVVEQDEDGVWCACAPLRPGVAAFGDGQTLDEALADLRVGLELLIEELGMPDEMTLALNTA
jgi:predicted RNase H-like HicB family nuclease